VGYWHQRADERHGNPPQGNQELLVVRDKVGRFPDELGVSKSMECETFPPSVLWHCWLGDRKGIWPVKSWVLICWWWWFVWSFARLIAPVVTTSSIILCFSKHRLTQVHLENGRYNGEREDIFFSFCMFQLQLIRLRFEYFTENHVVVFSKIYFSNTWVMTR